ncbi:NAD-dependent epimerase/dehydratase family protein [Curtanaerobium respiraculi]|uniref:NAD-dependent epimerase/dehydratase family protein n=1 Tax=Curtanaerobium respiraculi TaxID=2949669 RepID=UPI0024B37FF4|nr:NAD-dependent epimerase/dehydratase family protein [Curtanaerobium respiraculi]
MAQGAIGAKTAPANPASELALARCVVTGATGMLGCALVRLLAYEGIEVYALARPGSPRMPRFARMQGVHVVECDISHLDGAVADIPGRCDAFFHLAWEGTERAERDDAAVQVRNIGYTLDAVELAAALGCTVFVGAGSQAEYGRVEGRLGPSTPTHPETAYGIAKLAAGQISRVRAAALGLRHEWARIASVYGPGDRPSTMVMSVLRALRDGRRPQLTACEQRWDYLYCDDAARALELVAARGRDQAIYCVGSGVVRVLKDVVRELRDMVDPGLELGIGEIPYAPDQVMHLEVDISSLVEDTGFSPRVSLAEGMARTIASLDGSEDADGAPCMPRERSRAARTKISVVVPCLNEAENVVALYDALVTMLDAELPAYDYEILFIDNCSTDGTRDRIRLLCAGDRHVKAIFNTRDFGQFNSPYYGLCQTTGACAVLMCCDFQDPVELIPDFVHAWESGYKVVCGIKADSEENRLLRWLRTRYYRRIRTMSAVAQIEHFTGFGLYDASFVDVLRQLDDPTPFLRGIVAELGPARKDIPYTQRRRRAGKSHNGFASLYDAAMLSFTSYTKSGLRVATLAGFALGAASLVAALVYLVLKLAFWDSFSEGSVMPLLAVLMLGSVLLFFLGLLGEYVMAINVRVMKRPLVVEEERMNFDAGDAGRRAQGEGEDA